jgi:hypothetical protein
MGQRLAAGAYHSVCTDTDRILPIAGFVNNVLNPFAFLVEFDDVFHFTWQRSAKTYHSDARQSVRY